MGRPRPLRPRRHQAADGPRSRRAGSLGRPGGVRVSGAPGQRLALWRRPEDPARSRSCRGRPAERPGDRLAEAPTPSGPERFDAWAYRIVVHACYAEAPRNRRWATTVRVLPGDRADGTDDIQSISDRDELERAFRTLPLDQRAVFVLHHHVGLPLVAVAETLGIPDGTARSRLHYATRALRAAFDRGRAQAIPLEGHVV